MRRWAAPAAFLLAATIAVLLVRAALHGGGPSAQTTAATSATSQTSATPRTKPRPRPRYYVIRSGDTFGSVAIAQHTSVAKLQSLNPKVDPTALHVGQRIRVG